MANYVTTDNVGLPYKFSLTDTGAFRLVGGDVKVQDNLSFILTFKGFFRVYLSDFPPDILFLLQKPTSTIELYKTLILGKLLRTFTKYLPYIIVQKINLLYDYQDRKSWGIGIQYGYNLKKVGASASSVNSSITYIYV